MGPRRAAGAAGLARRRVPLRGSPDRAVEAAAGGEHVRVRGRARDVGDAEPHHGAGARAHQAAAQPVPAAAAAVGRQVPPLPRLLVDQGRRRRACQLRCCCCGIDIALPLSSVFFGFFFSGSRCLYCIVSSMYRRPSLQRALRCTFHSSSCKIGRAHV